MINSHLLYQLSYRGTAIGLLLCTYYLLRTYLIDQGRDGSPNRTRTCDPMINSHLLYQLSYRGMTLSITMLRVAPRTGLEPVTQ